MQYRNNPSDVLIFSSGAKSQATDDLKTHEPSFKEVLTSVMFYKTQY